MSKLKIDINQQDFKIVEQLSDCFDSNCSNLSNFHPLEVVK